MTNDEPSPDSCRVSVVAVPKPFRGHIGVIQDNAIHSWKQLSIAREVMLLGGEEGVREAAEAAGVTHHGQVQRDSLGTPLLDDVFRVASERAEAQWLCYVNADIILMPGFGDAVRRAMSTLGQCLIVSRRWNLDVRDRLSFGAGWEEEIRLRAANAAELFDPSGIDVFVFPKGLFPVVPPFALGRSAWDNWMIAEARRRGWPVVDVTAPYTVIHQNHSYDEFASMEDIRRSQQGLRNFWLAGDSPFLLGRVDDATHQLDEGKVVPSGRKSVSVVISNAGTLERLRPCLRAVSGQRYPRTHVEIIIVDTSAEHSSAAAVLEFSYVRVTRDTKPGAAAARNKGAAIANGDLIAFLDSACRPDRDWLREAVAAAERDGFTSIVACNIRPLMSDSGSAGVQWYEAITLHEPPAYAEIANACSARAMVVPRTVWREAGPFEESFVDAPCDDWDWLARASRRGIEITHAADAFVGFPVNRTWSELRDRSIWQARGEIRLAETSSRQLEFSALRRVYTRRLGRELRFALRDHRVPWRATLSAAMAAAWVWFWKLRESRRTDKTMIGSRMETGRKKAGSGAGWIRVGRKIGQGRIGSRMETGRTKPDWKPDGVG